MKIVFIFMGDPQCSKRRKKKNDYSQWGDLLKTAYSIACRVAGPQDDPCSMTSCGSASGQVAGPAADQVAGLAAGRSAGSAAGHDTVPAAGSSAGSDFGGPADEKTSCSMADATDPNEPMLLVLGGDLVNRGTNEDEWEAFFEAGGETLGAMNVITPTGNHDTRSDTGYETRFPLPANGPAGYEQRFYSYDQGCCHFMVLDTNYMGTRSQKGIRFIQEWMVDDLERNKKPVVFAVMHHPMFTVGSSLDDEVRAGLMRENYLPIMHRYGVDFILCGHQHLYCRTFPQHPAECGQHPAANSQKRVEFSSAADRSQDPSVNSRAEGYDQGPAGCAYSQDPGLVQIMGVSGTKYYNGLDLSKMEAVIEGISAATIISADTDHALNAGDHLAERSGFSKSAACSTDTNVKSGTSAPSCLSKSTLGSISIMTIDPDGNIVDAYEKPIRPKKPDAGNENALKQPLFFKKLPEQQTAENNADIINKRSPGCDAEMITDPFCSAQDGGITVRISGSEPFYFSDEQLKKMQWEEMCFSTLRGTELRQEIKYALPLENILKECGWHHNKAGQKSSAVKAEDASSGLQNLIRSASAATNDPVLDAPEKGITASINKPEGLDTEGSNLEGMNPEAMHIVSRYGKTTTVRLDEILYRKRFIPDPDGNYKEYPVRAAICIEDEGEPAGSTFESVSSCKSSRVGSETGSEADRFSGIDAEGKTPICYRLVFGQQDPDEYNTRQWIRNIAELELVEIP